jgi:hypothetical protein
MLRPLEARRLPRLTLTHSLLRRDSSNYGEEPEDERKTHLRGWSEHGTTSRINWPKDIRWQHLAVMAARAASKPPTHRLKQRREGRASVESDPYVEAVWKRRPPKLLQSLQRPKRIASRRSAPAAAFAAASSSVIREFPGKRYAPITRFISRPLTLCPIYCG